MGPKKEDMAEDDLEGKVGLLERKLKELTERFSTHKHPIEGTRCYFNHNQEPTPCKTGTPKLTTNNEKAQKVLEILDEIERKGEFEGLTLEEKETERQVLGMRLRKELD